jgi:hypothetical protein
MAAIAFEVLFSHHLDAASSAFPIQGILSFKDN